MAATSIFDFFKIYIKLIDTFICVFWPQETWIYDYFWDLEDIKLTKIDQKSGSTYIHGIRIDAR